MKKNYKAREEFRKIRRTLLVALCMLLVSSVMMVTTSYAWFIMAVSPEVTGITTNVAANGSLEIALLTTETYQNLSAIKAGVGQSLAANVLGANNTWGNLVDLNDESYGLNDIVLMPARLDITGDAASGYKIGQNGLLVPVYGYDGRVMSVDQNTISGEYDATKGTFTMVQQAYGVRAFGTSSNISAQAAALALAKSNIRTYTNEAKSFAATALTSNGASLFNIIIKNYTTENPSFNESDLRVIENMISSLNASLGKIDAAMRQAILAYAASQIEEEDLFIEAQKTILSDKPLSEVTAEASGLPEQLENWILSLESAQNDLNRAKTSCDALEGGSYTWDQLKNALQPIMNMDKIYVGEKLFPENSRDDLMGMVGKRIDMTLAPGSGVFADVADFAGDFSTNVSAMGSDIVIETMTLEDPVRLNVLSAGVSDLNAPGNVGTDKPIELDTTYGYALDFAFRTNAFGSSLMLQTDATQRVYEDSTSVATMGGGSYMEFSTDVNDFSIEQMVNLMDAIRVAFVDSSNNVIGIAKLNTSNRTTSDGVVTAPLYLYDFEISTDPENAGALIMGERQKEDSTLTALTKGVAKAVSVMVWLDGDVVDNSMVPAAAEDGLAMGGKLNLQFASSADLIPADNAALKNLATDKSGLSAALDLLKAQYEAGRGDHTSTSWEAFAAAYEYAQAVVDDPTSDDIDASIAAKKLALAQTLDKISVDTLNTTVDEIRELVGTAQDPAKYVLKGEDGTLSLSNSATGSIHTIYGLDPEKNEQDEGNGIVVQKYTDESWNNLANAIYNAEMLLAPGANPTDEQIDDAILGLQTARNDLERCVLYVPYRYENNLYYFAVTDPENADTYGKWYDANFKRVVSDLMILKLDAKAEETSIAGINAPDFVEAGAEIRVVGTIQFLTGLYPELKDEVIKTVVWTTESDFFEREEAQDGTVTFIRPSDSGSGVGTISAKILTESGVLFNLYKEITAFEKADGVKIEDAPTSGMAVGDKVMLRADLVPSGSGIGETVQSITWTSSAMGVVKVDSNGNITAVSEGSATIVVSIDTVQGYTYQKEVTIQVVKPAEPQP